MPDIREIIERDRQDLLDLSLKNPFLNYRYLKARGVEVRNVATSNIFDNFVFEEKPIKFIGQTDKTYPNEDLGGLLFSDEELEDLFNDSADNVESINENDIVLRSNESEKKINSRLLNSYYTARSYIEEQGVNILYVAFGMLKWFDPEKPEKANLAPLILVPAEIERKNVRELFFTKYTGGEIEYNLTLKLKLEKHFRIELPILPEGDISLQNYFSAVADVIAAQNTWEVDDEIVALGFFSFGKFMMYRDLDEENWDNNKKPSSNPLLNKLLSETGFNSSPSRFAEDEKIDKLFAPTDFALVRDADSTQILAIVEALEGKDLVIEGPPGTGKSQTITNLIAEALKKEKKVLFVAEKKAALEVVKRRLDEVHLGEACLELHSNKANKREVIAELKQTFDLGKPDLRTNQQLSTLKQIRDELNYYCEAVNCQIANSGISPYAAYGKLLKINKKKGENELPEIELSSALKWTPEQFESILSVLRNAEARLSAIGIPDENAFWGCRLSVVLPHEQEKIHQKIADCLLKTIHLIEKASDLAAQLGLPQPENISNIQVLIKEAKRAIESPHLKGIELDTNEWQLKRDDLRRLIKEGKNYSEIHEVFDEILIPEIWLQNLLEERQHLLTYSNKWWRFLISNYRRTKKKVEGFLKNPDLKKQINHLEIVDAVLEEQRVRQSINQLEVIAAKLFGSQWQGLNSEWNVIEQITEWICKLYDDIGENELPEGIVNFLLGEPNLVELNPLIEELEGALKSQDTSVIELIKHLDFDEPKRFGEEKTIQQQLLSYQKELFTIWNDNINEIQAYTKWNNLAEELKKLAVKFNDNGLLQFVPLAESWEKASSLLSIAFEKSYLEDLLEFAYQERPQLRNFSSTGQEEKIQQFIELDQKLIEKNRVELALKHWEHTPRYGSDGQLGILRREFEKKRRHLPLRQLIEKAGNAIQAIKPIFMMSPLSIANYLSPDSVEFDMIIFDEASQVRPVEAFGAVLRGKQLVVVGDSKQLPPSSFFDKLITDEDFDDESSTGDVESVLGLMRAKGSTKKMLKWHYRSRHESLIAVSNKEFYENKLQIFPSPDAERRASGLIYHYLPDTYYEPGTNKRYNLLEAEAVADAVMEHAKKSPGLSLLVATFSVAQRDAIINKLELKRRLNPGFENFFSAHPDEPFDVKNLENVQGDERDVVFISIGYGKTASGNVSMNFGPLNNDGGERRLNVLITRAKIRCEVFTNITSEDIDLTRTHARGVAALKTFLKYAQKGILDIPLPSDREMDSPFEEEVYEALVSQGYQVTPQVGSGGYFIDLAVKDLEQPGRYILGIECDGATYHSALSARDRDRLRQQVLEDLGWQIHRIWSTDWFRNPDQELKKVIKAIERANLLKDKKKQWSSENEIIFTLQRNTFDNTLLPKTIPMYKIADVNSDFAYQAVWGENINVMKKLIIEIVKVESPVHIEEVYRRISVAADSQRIGPRMRKFMDEVCSYVIGENLVIERDGFLFENSKVVEIRNRTELPSSSRRFEYISDDEIKVAIEQVVKDSFGIVANDLPQAICQMFGFSRKSEQIQNRILHLVEKMIAEGNLERVNDQITYTK